MIIFGPNFLIFGHFRVKNWPMRGFLGLQWRKNATKCLLRASNCSKMIYQYKRKNDQFWVNLGIGRSKNRFGRTVSPQTALFQALCGLLGRSAALCCAQGPSGALAGALSDCLRRSVAWTNGWRILKSENNKYFK